MRVCFPDGWEGVGRAWGGCGEGVGREGCDGGGEGGMGRGKTPCESFLDVKYGFGGNPVFCVDQCQGLQTSVTGSCCLRREGDYSRVGTGVGTWVGIGIRTGVGTEVFTKGTWGGVTRKTGGLCPKCFSHQSLSG